jgi:hypothetical protein
MSIDEISEKIARRTANRFSRRSFIGRVGTTIAVAGAGSLGIHVPMAAAAGCCGCAHCGFSSVCTEGGGSCPSGTCQCGSWYICQNCQPGAPTLKKFTDCCSACGGGCFCGADGYPHCFYNPPYGACGGYSKVRCRTIDCTNLAC